MTDIDNFPSLPIKSSMDSIDVMDLSDTTPLDLSVKASSYGPADSAMSEAKLEAIESLSHLAHLQDRFMPTSDRKNYADQLQKVTNGPTLGPTVSSHSTANFPKVSPSPSPYWSGDWSSIYHNMPLQYQLAASQLLWNSGYAAATASIKSSPVSPSSKSPTGATFRSENLQERSAEQRPSNRPRKFFESSLSTAAAPPEAFGISMRGNQKYSAYYQRPFLVPLAPSKRSDTSSKRSINDQHPSPSDEKEKIATLPRTGSKETSFQCSCGEEFENLYIFTLHMKESNHSPKCARNERDIPKLVRGQDMWINSEIEQTREILRCMRCHQSFRTLPDLTMHMIKTSHYSEIVYSDSGRCVFVNSEENNNNASKKAGDKRSASNENVTSVEKNTTVNKEPVKPTECHLPKKMPRLKPEIPLTVKTNFSKSEQSNDKEGPVSDKIEVDDDHFDKFPEKVENRLPQITEADSATIDSLTDSNSDISLQDSQSLTNEKMPTLTSVISQIESFVEKNLPKASSSSSLEASITELPVSTPVNSITSDVKRKDHRHSDSLPYVAPDGGARPSENPLSSLQKLVETTHKTKNKDFDRIPPEALKISNKSMVSSSCNLESSSTNGLMSAFPANNPTVIMVNPTYIYQPAIPGIPPPLYSYPWYQSLPMYGAAMGTNVSASDDEVSTNGVGDTKGDISPAESPKCDDNSIHSPTVNSQESKTNNSLNNYHSIPGDTPAPLPKKNSNCATGANMISKKAKCNYCGKPFANKGQVRLHISKGKCPSLLQSCHSSELPTLMTNPFSYIPLDYSDRSSEDRLRMLYSLTKHMITKESR